jgi:hypothetical protein
MLFARFWRWLRRRPEPPVFDEAKAYERCHGQRATDLIVRPKPPRAPRLLPKLRGDYLQRCFEERLEKRRVAHL